MHILQCSFIVFSNSLTSSPGVGFEEPKPCKSSWWRIKRNDIQQYRATLQQTGETTASAQQQVLKAQSISGLPLKTNKSISIYDLWNNYNVIFNNIIFSIETLKCCILVFRRKIIQPIRVRYFTILAETAIK